MHVLHILHHLLLLLLPLSFTLTTYLYLYPLFHHCTFTHPTTPTSSFSHTLKSHLPFASQPNPDSHDLAPFRLLALGDPQLEGSTSLPQGPSFSHLFSSIAALRILSIRNSLHDIIDFAFIDIPDFLEGQRKRLDLWGNDYYLAHIYRTLKWWTRPTHVAVLGDLLGSQWIDDGEFEERSRRYWGRVFKDGKRVEDELMDGLEVDEMDGGEMNSGETKTGLVLGEDAEEWERRIINIAGNHDIGYAGDLDEVRVDRFVREFGKVNYELRFQLPNHLYRNTTTNNTSGFSSSQDTPDPTYSKPTTPPELRLIILNSMNLDTPALSQSLQDETYAFLNRAISASHTVSTSHHHFTLLLTHIPLHKPAGICIDAPYFSYHPEGSAYEAGIREQNHLSPEASRGILEGIFGINGDAETSDGKGIGRKGLIINGHDHQGCDIYHYINQTSPPPPSSTTTEEDSPPLEEKQWQVKRYHDAAHIKYKRTSGLPGIREVTLRAMMGEYGGHAGLVSIWFDPVKGEWDFHVGGCAVGTQHVWWGCHVLDLITLALVVVYIPWKMLYSAGIVGGGQLSLVRREGKVDVKRPAEAMTLIGHARPLTPKKVIEARHVSVLKSPTASSTSRPTTTREKQHEHRRFKSEGEFIDVGMGGRKRSESLVFSRVE